jgi:hypothetical protein
MTAISEISRSFWLCIPALFVPSATFRFIRGMWVLSRFVERRSKIRGRNEPEPARSAGLRDLRCRSRSKDEDITPEVLENKDELQMFTANQKVRGNLSVPGPVWRQDLYV